MMNKEQRVPAYRQAGKSARPNVSFGTGGRRNKS
jgi:hypothetical protein